VADSKRIVAGITIALGVAVAVVMTLAAGCGGDDDGIVAIEAPGPPVGRPELPDLAPAPPQDVQLRYQHNRWNLRFSSILVNIGKGPFVLRAARDDDTDPWHVEQDVPYSTSGAKATPVGAKVVWGGDGHNHWHIQRVAKTWLVPLGADGQPTSRSRRLIDAKVGFCFFDYSRLIEIGPKGAVYQRQTCGDDEENTSVGMGLSTGWVDIYAYHLPGQAIDITDVPDGEYRLYDSVDEAGWFRETNKQNNVSWANIKLATKANEDRTVTVTDPGPPIRGPSS
jgi:hypothetical protein